MYTEKKHSQCVILVVSKGAIRAIRIKMTLRSAMISICRKASESLGTDLKVIFAPDSSQLSLEKSVMCYHNIPVVNTRTKDIGAYIALL